MIHKRETLPGDAQTPVNHLPLARAAALDGLAVNDAGRPYVAANGAGQIWRVEPRRGHPRARTRPQMPSAVAIGHGSDGFREGNLYAVTFHGDVVELAGAAR